MSRTTTYQKLLERCSSPVQTHIILAQLQLLRKQDKLRTSSERGGALAPLILALTVVFVVSAWVAISITWAQHLSLAIHGR